MSIGYTGEVSEQELDSPDFAKYSQGDVIGKFGIERQYNDLLMGVDGERQVMVDNRGDDAQGAREQGSRCRARTCKTTLDLDFQAVAELAMEKAERTARWWRWIRIPAKCWQW